VDTSINISFLKYLLLKRRIKKNEGFSKTPYKDQLGNYTIGYGHLIKKNERYFFIKNFKKDFFQKLFEEDFKKAQEDYLTNLYKNSFSKKTEELLIEMIFQMGIKKVLCFKKMLLHIKNNKKYLASLEMMNSAWYKQTPHRVEVLIKFFLK